MENKYNILWLDDEPIKPLEIIRAENPEISFEHVQYVDKCQEILESQSKKYDAVILDANGICSDSLVEGTNKKGFLKLVDTAIANNILLYIYSGHLDRPSDSDADLALEALELKGLKEGETIFYKSGGSDKMINKIKEALNSKYQYYVKHKYLLEFFSKGWIRKEYKTSFLDSIMEAYCKENINSAYGNQMRNIAEQILQKVNEIYKLTNMKKDDSGYYASIAKGTKKREDLLYPMSGPLTHMVDMANAHSHSALPEDVRKLYFDSDFSTFFLMTKWFYELMKRHQVAEPLEERIVLNDASKADVPKTETSANSAEKPQPRSEERTTITVPTYKKDGKTYIDITAEVPWWCKDYDKVKISKISPWQDENQHLKWKVWVVN